MPLFLTFRLLGTFEAQQQPQTQQPTPENTQNYYFAPTDIREKSHIFYRDGNTYFYNKNVFSPSYVLVDPRPFSVKFTIQV